MIGRIVCCFVIMGFAGMPFTGNDPRPADKTAIAKAEPGQENHGAPTFEVAGKGDQVTQKFSLQSGLSIWHVTNEGPSNFQVSLLNDQGKSVDMAVNEIGSWNGTFVVRVPKTGDYLLNVKSTGNWTVAIREPRPEAGQPKPIAKQGRGTDVPVFVTLPEGLSVFRVKHTGDGIFRVKLYDREGKLVEHVFAQIGPYEGSKAISLDKEGIFAVGISANGAWSLKIE